MNGVGTAAAVLLAALLAVAAGAKLRDRTATASTFAALGLAAPSALAVAVPVTELLVGAALVAAPRVGGIAAVVLLLGMTGVLVRAAQAPTPVPCACFGAASVEPVGPPDLVRNGVLLLAAGAAAAVGEPTAPGLAEIMVVTSVVAIGAMAAGLVRLRGDLGAVWATDLPGETGLDPNQGRLRPRRPAPVTLTTKGAG